MTYSFSLEDVAFLRSPEGAAGLAECARLPLTQASRISDVAVAREVVGAQYAPAVLETVLLRRRAHAKLAHSTEWLLSEEGLEQASASVVAAHRASRLVGRNVHDVTCSIGADLVALAATAEHCVGSDVDTVRLAMAEHNCHRAGFAPVLTVADALRPTTQDTVVVADPARRDSAGRRRWTPSDFRPPLDDLATTYRGRDVVVKCAPGIDPAAAPWADEVELVSLDGQVREACLWAGSLAGASRRASVLRADGGGWSITDDESDEVTAAEPGEWIVDPDGAVVRAGLVRHYAARHGLWQLDERIAYLTGHTPPSGLRAFRILEYGAFAEKYLRTVLRRREVGRLEILVRGVDVDPDLLRRRLKLNGDQEATVVLTRIGRKPVAFVCRAERV